MDLIYYHHPVSNFGDDLNAVLWPRLIPSTLLAQNDDVGLLGIGSIFNAKLPGLRKTKAKRIFVIGSGAGYGALPPNWQSWQILAVRGPLTAALIDKPEASVTDGAALLRHFPDLVKRSANASEVVLMPHYNSAERGQWEHVAMKLGFVYVDPRWSVTKVLSHLTMARLVITEAMHGAIVADTMRIPWIPILIEPDALPFKWTDWTRSVELPYKPLYVPASSGREALYHLRQRASAKRSGLQNSARLKNLSNTQDLLSDFRARYQPASTSTAHESPKHTVKRSSSAVSSAVALADPFFIHRAVDSLQQIAKGESFLSANSVLDDRVNRLLEVVKDFVRMAG